MASLDSCVEFYYLRCGRIEPRDHSNSTRVEPTLKSSLLDTYLPIVLAFFALLGRLKRSNQLRLLVSSSDLPTSTAHQYQNNAR